MNGSLVVDDGRVLTVDEAGLLDEADEVARRIREHLASRRYWPVNHRYRIIDG